MGRLQNDLYKTFWATCHTIFAAGLKAVPLFDLGRGYAYFRDTLSQPAVGRSFNTPNWIPRLPKPVQAYTPSVPSYRDIARTVNKCKLARPLIPLTSSQL